MITQQLSFRDDEAMRIKLRRRPLPDYLTVLENYGPRKRGMRSVVRVFNASRKMSAEGDEAAAAYHAFECGITELFYQANVGCWPLAYRGAIQSPPSLYLCT